MAQEARVQERYAAAYIEILTVTGALGQWCQLVRPMFDTDPPQQLRVDLPSLADQARSNALARAYGSEQVNSLIDAHRQAVQDIIDVDRQLQIHAATKHAGDVQHSGIEPTQIYRQLHQDLRPAEVAARKELESQIARELQQVEKE